MGRRIHIILILLAFLTDMHAQPFDEKNFTRYTTADGLSHNIITGLAQDQTGFLWITTAAGINRFNGTKFVQYHSNSDTASLASEDAVDAVWLNKHELAVLSNGLHIINAKTGRTRNLFIPYHDKQYQYKFNVISRVRGDDNGNIYILTRSGFYHFDKNDKLVSRFDYYSEKDVPVTHFFFGRELVELDSDRLAIVSIGGIYLYDKREGKIRKMRPADCPMLTEFINSQDTYLLLFQFLKGNLILLKKDSIININVSKNRSVASYLPIQKTSTEFHYMTRLFRTSDTSFILTGHSTGFYKMRFNKVTGRIESDAIKHFPTYQCRSILKASDNAIWVGTNKGLLREDKARSQVEIVNMPIEVERDFPNIIMHEIHTTDDKVFVGTRSPGHLFVFDKSDLRLLKTIDLIKERSLYGKTLSIFSIAETVPGSILLGTDGPLFLIDKGASHAKPLVPKDWNVVYDWCNELFKDSRNIIWISSSNVYRYQPTNGFLSYFPREFQLSSQIDFPEAIREDADGNIWMAGHGLSRYNMTTHKFDLVVDNFPYIKMPNKQISTMEIDKKRNIIWFNSSNNGLISYSINDRKFQQFTTADGLPDNNITSMTIVGDKLWVAGNSGVGCLDFRTNVVTGFGKEDGFPDLPVFNRANFHYDSLTKKLYLAFSKAIVRFDPGQMLRKKAAPDVFIEELKLSGGETQYLPSGEIKTSWKNNGIQVTIGAINFMDGSSQRYAYRIVNGKDMPWVDLGSQPSFSISRLPAGSHTIQVKVYSLTNRWPEQIKELKLEVSPPFWRTTWFIALFILLLSGLFFLMVRWRTSIARKKEMVKTHIEKLKADDYKNQFELEQISNYFSSSLAGKRTRDEVLWDVASNLIGRMGYEDCIIYMWNKDKTRMIQKAAYGPKGKPDIINTNVFEVEPGQGIVGHVIETGQPLLIGDTRQDKRYRVDDEFRLSEIAVPIIHNDELLGVIDSENKQANYFSERDIKILTTIATLIGNKLKQLESEQSLEAKQKELLGINEQLSEARLSALQAQMNPHFVFNALNSIKRMILDGDNERASRYLSKFALMIRMTLEHSKEIFVTIDENIEYLKAYLEMERLRFDDSFSYKIVADESVDTSETVLPSMMIQPLVENAIWHGLMQSGPDKKILVGFKQTDHRITCTIEDNGIGIQQSEKMKEKNRPLHRSVGLENLQKRIKIMNEKYDTECSLQILDLKEEGLADRGTRVVLQFKLINA